MFQKHLTHFHGLFLLELLHCLALVGSAVTWFQISSQVTTPSATIILNGEPGESINHQQEIIANAFHASYRWFVKADEEGFLQPLSNHSAGDL